MHCRSPAACAVSGSHTRNFNSATGSSSEFTYVQRRNPDSRAREQTHQAAPREPLPLVRELRVPAAQNVQRRRAHHHQPAPPRHPRQFPRRVHLLAQRQVRDHVDRHHQVERAIGERQRANISLHRTAARRVRARSAGRARSGPSARSARPRSRCNICERYPVPQPASSARSMRRPARCGSIMRNRIARIPRYHQKVFFALADVGELRRVHEIGHVAGDAPLSAAFCPARGTIGSPMQPLIQAARGALRGNLLGASFGLCRSNPSPPGLPP